MDYHKKSARLNSNFHCWLHNLSLLLIMLLKARRSSRGAVSTGARGCRQRRVGPHYVVHRRAVRSRTGLGSVGEGQARGVDDAVVADQTDGDLGRLSHPLPTTSELTDVRNHAQHVLLTSVHRVAFHVTEPDSQVGIKILTSQLQHRNFSATVYLSEQIALFKIWSPFQTVKVASLW